MISLSAFLDAIQANVSRITHYQSGGDGKGGGCDCIGLIIGAIRLAGGEWKGTHGSNYAARNEMRSLGFITTPYLGEIVYKAKEPGQDGYDLPAKYQSSGDLLDYYHVGVVTSVNPLTITHCTSVAGGIKRDSTLGQWRFGGELKLVDYGESDEPMEALYQATVTAVSGRTVNLRANPSEKARVLKSVPVGSVVDVLDDTDPAWSKITYNSITGYMMSKFLTVPEEINLREELEQARDHLVTALEIVEKLLSGDVG